MTSGKSFSYHVTASFLYKVGVANSSLTLGLHWLDLHRNRLTLYYNLRESLFLVAADYYGYLPARPPTSQGGKPIEDIGERDTAVSTRYEAFLIYRQGAIVVPPRVFGPAPNTFTGG